MKIRMAVSIAGVDFALSPGDVTDRFGAEEAARLVKADYAVVIAGDTVVQVSPAEVRAGEPGGGETSASSDVQPAENVEGEGVDPAVQSEGEGEPPSAPIGETGESDDKVALQAEAEGVGVDVDKRWGVARLKAEIEAAKAKAAG